MLNAQLPARCPRCEGFPPRYADRCPRCGDAGAIELGAEYDVDLDARVAGDELERRVLRVLVRARIHGPDYEARAIAQGLVRLEPARRLAVVSKRLGDDELAREVCALAS